MNIAMTAAHAENPSEYEYLGLLARTKKALDQGQEVAVPVDDIRRYPNQPRKHFPEDGIRRLADSILAGGQIVSGLIRENPAETRYELIDGERRWRAIHLISSDERPLYKAKLIDADDDVIQFLISGAANFNRAGHTSVEIMETIDRLVSFKIPMKEIAVLLGITEGWAYQMHGLKKLKPEILKLLDPSLPRAEQLPLAAAVQISKIEQPYQMGLVQRVLTRDVSVGRLRSEVVKLAEREGVPIRLREVSPLKQWESFSAKLKQIARTTGDTKSLMDRGHMGRFLRVRKPEAARLMQDVQQAIKDLERIGDEIKKYM